MLLTLLCCLRSYVWSFCSHLMNELDHHELRPVNIIQGTTTTCSRPRVGLFFPIPSFSNMFCNAICRTVPVLLWYLVGFKNKN